MTGHRERILSSNPEAGDLYAAMVTYLLSNGWRREELGSGWWWKEDASSDLKTEDAVGEQMEADGIDFRTMLDGEPQEFWG